MAERVLLLVLAVGVAGCGDGEPLPVAIPQGSSFEYRLTTEWDGAETTDAGHRFTTSRGYTVELRALHVGVGTITLVPCAEEPVAFRFGPRIAYADHSWDMDGSLLEPSRADALPSGTALALGPAEASGATYCDLFWTVAAVDDTAQDGLTLRGLSVWMEATLIGPDGTTRELTATSRLGHGARRPLVGTWESGAHIYLVRHPVIALDDIEFDELTDSEVAFEVATQLGTTSTAEIGPGMGP